MSEAGDATRVEGLTAACSRSAQALRLAILAVDDRKVLVALRAAYLARVELFEVCARCLAAGAAASQRLVELAGGTEAETPPTATEAMGRVSMAERGFERAVMALGCPVDDDHRRLAALARRQLATGRLLRRGGARRRDDRAEPAPTAPPAAG